MIPNVRNYLNQFNIYLDQTYLSTFDNAKVGGLILSHCQWTRRDVATRDLNVRINENEKDKTPIQLSPYGMWNGKEGNKISTKLLAVECAREHIQTVKHRMFTKLLNVPPAMELSNTKYFKFIPFNPSGAISDKVIRSGIYLQNKFLIQSAAITIINVNNIDWVVPNHTDTFKAVVLAVPLPNENSKLFSSVEMGISDNKAHLVTTKAGMEYATRWIDEFAKAMRGIQEEKLFWKERTGFKHPPERINTPIDSDAQSAYANFLTQTFSPLVGKEIESLGMKNAPERPSYSRVVYGSQGTTRNNIPNAQSPAISTITSEGIKDNRDNGQDIIEVQEVMNTAISVMQEKASAGQAEMKKTLLEEMKALNDEAKDRMVRIEESSNTYDSMLQQLHQNNMAKAQEMAKYETRFEQISTTTANTNQKVDKLNYAMKTFIKVMADVIGTNSSNETTTSSQENLHNLVQFLEEQEQENDTCMDIEEESNKRKLSPGNTDIALGGESDQK